MPVADSVLVPTSWAACCMNSAHLPKHRGEILTSLLFCIYGLAEKCKKDI